MKVLQINSVCGIGSTGRLTTDLYKIIVEHGHECRIAYGRGTAPEDYPTIRIGSNPDVYRHALYSRLTDQTAFASRKATECFLEKVRAYDPDVIHLHNIHGYYIHLELLFNYLMEAGKPVIWTFHDCWPFTGHCCHFEYIGCNKWKTGCYRCEQKNAYPTSYFCDRSYRNYLRKKSILTGFDQLIIVSPTKWLSDLVKESFLKSCPSLVIPCGIDLDVFKPVPSNLREKYQLKEKYVVLGVCNRFNKNKGLDYFIKLAYNLPSQYQLILIGIEDKQKRLLPKQVLTFPRTNNANELAQFYTMADVFVNPTLQENQGMTNIEALACGTGVVSFQSGGCTESLNEHCGYVVKRDDLKGLIHGVMKACKTPFDSKACIERAKSYDKSRLSEYVKLYEDSYNLLNRTKEKADNIE